MRCRAISGFRGHVGAARRFVIWGEVPDVEEFLRSGGLGDN